MMKLDLIPPSPKPRKVGRPAREIGDQAQHGPFRCASSCRPFTQSE
jgi:hypothetical protein